MMSPANPGSFISTVDGGCSHPGTRIIRLRITSSTPFVLNGSPKWVWSWALASGRNSTTINVYNQITRAAIPITSSTDVAKIANNINFDKSVTIYGCNVNPTVNPATNVTLQLKMFIEGFYIGNGLMQPTVNPATFPLICDTIEVALHSSTPPYTSVVMSKNVLSVSGIASIQFPLSVLSNSYYIVVHHRNAITTWSSSAVLMNGANVSYDFSTAASKAYGNSQRQLNDGKFAFWSGDISHADLGITGIQDGVIESQDYTDMENSVYFTLLGYIVQDLTGDRVVESSDYSLMESNVYYSIAVVKP
jgi:hypothetical protein